MLNCASADSFELAARPIAASLVSVALALKREHRIGLRMGILHVFIRKIR